MYTDFRTGLREEGFSTRLTKWLLRRAVQKEIARREQAGEHVRMEQAALERLRKGGSSGLQSPAPTPEASTPARREPSYAAAHSHSLESMSHESTVATTAMASSGSQ